MKKKLLSLVLAGAMVASTSVSAFAAEPTLVGNGKINGPDNQEYSTNVNIEGNVESDGGQVKPGTLSVTVPTTAAFTVYKNGDFQGTQINVENLGTQSVDVYAYRFVDTTPTEGKGISAIAKNRLSEVKRTMVSLSVRGDEGTAYLGSALGGKNGIYEDENLARAVDEVKIATVAKSSSKQLELQGEAGKKNKDNDEANGKVEEAVNDNFTLTLKIKKSANS